MSFFLVYDFVILELLGLIISIGYIIFHFGYRVHNTYQDVRSNMTKRIAQRKKIQSKLKKAQAMQAKAAASKPTELKPDTKKKLTAGELQAIEGALKKVHAKNAVKEFEQARAAIIEGLTVDKHNQQLNVLLAQYYERKLDYPKAEIIFKDLILFHEPKESDLYIYLGDNLMRQEKPKLAYEVYKQALSRDEGNIDVLFALSDLAYEILDYEASMRYAQEIIKKQSKNIPALEILAQAYMQLEQYQKAYDTFLKIRRLDPYNTTVQKWVERLEDKLGIHPEVKKHSSNS